MSGLLPYLLIVALLGGLLWWHTQENRSISGYLSGIGMPEADLKKVMNLLFSRTLLLLITLICGLFIYIAYDMKLKRADVRTQEAVSQLQKADMLVQQLRNTPCPQPSCPVPAQENVSTVFTPPAGSTQQQDQLNLLKQRYEEMFVNFLFLSRCSRATQQDYYRLYNIMDRELRLLSAPASMRTDIPAAAQGSYNEVYARVQCNTGEVGNMADQFYEYIRRTEQSLTEREWGR